MEKHRITQRNNQERSMGQQETLYIGPDLFGIEPNGLTKSPYPQWRRVPALHILINLQKECSKVK